MAEIALPANALRNRLVARWVRDQHVAVDLRAGEDLAIAVAAGIHPSRLTLHAELMSDSDLRVAAQLGIGVIRVGSITHVESLAAVDYRRQGIVVCLTDGATGGFRFDSLELDRAVGAIMAGNRFNFRGLTCGVGSHGPWFFTYPPAGGPVVPPIGEILRQHPGLLPAVGF